MDKIPMSGKNMEPEPGRRECFMALMETHYYSFAIGSNVALNVLIPTPTSSEQIVEMNHSQKYDYEKGLPVIYLLHGAYGDAFSWIRFSNIDRYAQDRGIAVVMADGSMSFYQNLRDGRRFEDFFAKELPEFITSVFPVSRRREDTFIGGFSMGGYGAWYLGLKYADQYAGAASMSGALELPALYRALGNKPKEENNPFNWENSFGENLKNLSGSGNDLLVLYERAAEKNMVPALYQAVGYDDFLYDSNQDIRKALEQKKAPLTYEEGSGGHEWNFWDCHVQHILDWMLNIREQEKKKLQ